MSAQGMATQAVAKEIVDALLADEKDGGFDLTAGLFGRAFSTLVRRFAAVELKLLEIEAQAALIAEYKVMPRVDALKTYRNKTGCTLEQARDALFPEEAVPAAVPLDRATVKQWEIEAREDLPNSIGTDFDDFEVLLDVAQRAATQPAAQALVQCKPIHPKGMTSVNALISFNFGWLACERHHGIRPADVSEALACKQGGRDAA